MKWFGFEQGPHAHPVRPWWQKVPDGSRRRWYHPSGDYFEDRHPHEEIFKMMSGYDKSHPLPIPPPHAGQVWVLKEGHEILIKEIEDGIIFWGASRIRKLEHPWPPVGAVLVSGEGAPWAPSEAVLPELPKDF